jgi:3-oxoacyl-[acyl-carrier-protein] synthase-3
MAKAKIIGMGIYVPGKPISNDEVQKLTGVVFDSAKIEAKLGIKNRHIAKLSGINESTADFVTKAALQAIEKANIKASEIGAFVVGTDTPEYISPCTALIVQGRIQEQETTGFAFDINASCASFTIALDVVSKMMASDPNLKYALVAGVYNMPAYIRDGDAFGYSIFADGAGAFILQRANDYENSGYISGHQVMDGTQWNYVGIYAGGTKNPITHQTLENGKYGLELLQNLPGDRNVKLWPAVVRSLLQKNNKNIEDVDHFIFTQINRHVIIQVMEELKLPMEKTTCIMDQYGYTGSGCIPMAMYHAVLSGKVKRGDTVAFIASGAGLAVGSNLFVF